MIHPALVEYLMSVSDVTDEISDRFYPFGGAPIGGDRPFATYFIDDNLHVQNQGGPSGLANPRVQIDIWSDSKLEAARILDIFRIALDNFRGTMGTGANERTVRKIVIDADREDFAPPTDGSEKGFYRASADFLVWFVEEVWHAVTGCRHCNVEREAR